MTAADAGAVRYPKRLEVFRLEALGDDPYYGDEEAKGRYLTGQALTVIPGDEPIEWKLSVSSSEHPFSGDSYRFSVTSHTASKAVLREVTWETVAGELFCRRIVDLFYPNGDPFGGAPSTDVIRVTQLFFTDGVAQVIRTSPIQDDSFREVADVPQSGLRRPLPAFGDWADLVAASSPDDMPRFGLDTIDAAEAFAGRCASRGAPVAAGRGWRIDGTEGDVLAAVRAIVRFQPVESPVTVLDRGPLRILPLAAQGGDPRSAGRDPHEERRRMKDLADRVRDAFAQHEGSPIDVELGRHGDDRVAAYAASLRAAGATRATWWEFDSLGVVLVWAGSETIGDLTLAVHITPVSWVSERQTKPGGGSIDVAWSREELVA
ncbi:hypothetical protein AB3M83_12280 [Microbacterium sp. 179-B 1A2 NHS]|uniref:hypothetical protein n=1 Tax=Microbacterium sp. 179-B 1A2 NHS TaxID=3142383 RepID=UPI0039A2ADE1